MALSQAPFQLVAQFSIHHESNKVKLNDYRIKDPNDLIRSDCRFVEKVQAHGEHDSIL